MIDIHSHILPMIDDGASSVEEALDMLVMAYEDGTDAIVLTPHFAIDYDFNNHKNKIKFLFEDLKEIVNYEGIPIQLYLGCEYLFTSPKDYEKQKKDITSIHNTSFILLEFYFDTTCEEINEAIHCLQKDGFHPILAHPERYDCIQENPSFAIDLSKNKNVYLQMNKGSVLGRYGQTCLECTQILLKSHCYHFVGSDAHHSHIRTPLMNDAYEKIKSCYGKDYAKELFYLNAENIFKF